METEMTEVEKLKKLQALNDIIATLDEIITKIDKENYSECIKEKGDPELALAYLAMVEMMEENMDSVTAEFEQFKEKVYDNLDPLTELM